MIGDSSWLYTWARFAPDEAKPLDNTIKKPRQGMAGLALFPAGVYPACSMHGAMLKVAKDAAMWRCPECNIGAELLT